MDKLNILWTSNDRDTLKNMVSMYSINSLKHGWFDAVNIVIWGGATRLAGTDADAQKQLEKMLAAGVTIEACKACADDLKVSETLSSLGIAVKYMGIPLTDYIKGDDHLITV